MLMTYKKFLVLFETDPVGNVGNVAHFSKSATKCCASSLIITILKCFGIAVKRLWH